MNHYLAIQTIKVEFPPLKIYGDICTYVRIIKNESRNLNTPKSYRLFLFEQYNTGNWRSIIKIKYYSIFEDSLLNKKWAYNNTLYDSYEEMLLAKMI